MRWAVLASASSRTSPTGRLSAPAFDHRRDPVEPVARDVDDEIRRAHASRPDIGLVRGAHDGDDDPVRAQRLAGAFECVTADGVDNSIEGPGVQLRANAIAFHDRLGTQRPNPFDVPGARGSVDAGAGFLRHLRRAGADAARRTAHQDRLPRFDTRVLEQHLPRGNGDDRKPRRCDVVERGGLERDLVGLDQRVLGIAADELVVRRAVW